MSSAMRTSPMNAAGDPARRLQDASVQARPEPVDSEGSALGAAGRSVFAEFASVFSFTDADIAATERGGR
jgi:hypothetical protein